LVEKNWDATGKRRKSSGVSARGGKDRRRDCDGGRKKKRKGENPEG